MRRLLSSRDARRMTPSRYSAPGRFRQGPTANVNARQSRRDLRRCRVRSRRLLSWNARLGARAAGRPTRLLGRSDREARRRALECGAPLTWRTRRGSSSDRAPGCFSRLRRGSTVTVNARHTRGGRRCRVHPCRQRSRNALGRQQPRLPGSLPVPSAPPQLSASSASPAACGTR